MEKKLAEITKKLDEIQTANVKYGSDIAMLSGRVSGLEIGKKKKRKNLNVVRSGMASHEQPTEAEAGNIDDDSVDLPRNKSSKFNCVVS